MSQAIFSRDNLSREIGRSHVRTTGRGPSLRMILNHILYYTTISYTMIYYNVI